MTHSDRLHASARRWRALGAGLPLLLLACAGHAQDTGESRFAFDGFGTLGWVHSDEENADFVGGLLIRSGAGHTRSWSPEVDSRLGLQLTAQLHPRLSGVLQVISEQQYDGDYRPRVEWANLQFELAPDVDLRVGRTVLANFLVSDFRKVGYINPWVRPPVEVYSLVPVTTSDGVDVSWRLTTGSITHTLHAGYGRADRALPGGGQAHARRAWGMSDTLEYGGLTARLNYRQGALAVDPYNTLFDAFRQFGSEGIAIAERLDADGDTFHFASLGVSYDPGAWFVTGEWGLLRSHSAIGERSSWYGSAGYRWQGFTPYVIYAGTHARELDASGLTVANYPPELAQTVLALNAGLADVLSNQQRQKTASVGVRWDFRENLALKLQYDHTRLAPGTFGGLSNVQPGFEPGGDVDLLSVCLDFVF